MVTCLSLTIYVNVGIHVLIILIDMVKSEDLVILPQFVFSLKPDSSSLVSRCGNRLLNFV